MKTVVFNSTMKCQGCIDKVKTYLDEEAQIKEWDVNLTNPGKTLKIVREDSLTDDEVVSKVKDLGYVLTKVSEE